MFQPQSFKEDKIRDEKEATKAYALSTGKIDKYEYITGKEIYLQIIFKLQNKLSLLIFVQIILLKKKKNPKNHGEKQIKAVEEQGKQLAKSNARGEKKVEHLIGNKKYSVNLLRKK